VAKAVDALLWFAMAMSGTALQLMLAKLLLSFSSCHLLRQQLIVIGGGVACFHATAGANYATLHHTTCITYCT